MNTVWISCEGENPADVENMGPIEYYPRQGFPGYYFPYENSEGYLSPLVAIHFTKPTRKSPNPFFLLCIDWVVLIGRQSTEKKINAFTTSKKVN